MKLKLAAVALLCAVGVGALVYSFGGLPGCLRWCDEGRPLRRRHDTLRT